MLCSTRSNPLTHITRARYLFAALLAAACDRLISGAGRYPWLAVAGIYAIPVAWNLVVIAGHTGFHIVPAVVYALVAVVCAVGVWQVDPDVFFVERRYRKYEVIEDV